MKPNKYRAQKVTIDQRKFDSTAEAARYLELKDRERKGLIKLLQCQVPYTLLEKSVKRRAVKFVLDFEYTLPGPDLQTVREDVKGMVTAVFRVKAKMMAANGHPVTIIKREDIGAGYLALAADIRNLGTRYSTVKR